MKSLPHRIYTIVAILTFAVAVAFAAPGSKVGVSFDRTTVDFGTVHAADGDVHLEYTMTNTSDKAVVILTATSSCGCTEPEYVRRPLLSGESTVIKVTFRTSGQQGEIDKEVTLRIKQAGGKTEKVKLILRGAVVP